MKLRPRSKTEVPSTKQSQMLNPSPSVFTVKLKTEINQSHFVNPFSPSKQKTEGQTTKNSQIFNPYPSSLTIKLKTDIGTRLINATPERKTSSNRKKYIKVLSSETDQQLKNQTTRQSNNDIINSLRNYLQKTIIASQKKEKANPEHFVAVEAVDTPINQLLIFNQQQDDRNFMTIKLNRQKGKKKSLKSKIASERESERDKGHRNKIHLFSKEKKNKA